jgi:hypothetical protein
MLHLQLAAAMQAAGPVLVLRHKAATALARPQRSDDVHGLLRAAPHSQSE